MLTGAGTSAYIGECLAPALATWAARVDAIPTTDLVASPQSYLSRSTPTLLVSFARSGNSPESVAAVRLADACIEHCAHLVVTCDAEGALAQCARKHSHARRRPAAGAQQRSQLRDDVELYRHAAGGRAGLGCGARRLRAIRSWHRPRRGYCRTACLDSAARRARNFERVVYLGSKELKGLAREAALKMLELTDGKVVAVADSPLGFRHGPKTILNRQARWWSCSAATMTTRGSTIGIWSDELRRDGVAGRVVDALVPGPSMRTMRTISCLGYGEMRRISRIWSSACRTPCSRNRLRCCDRCRLGCRPDNPNAAGTVSRVVKGVSIHPWRGSA